MTTSFLMTVALLPNARMGSATSSHRGPALAAGDGLLIGAMELRVDGEGDKRC